VELVGCALRALYYGVSMTAGVSIDWLLGSYLVSGLCSETGHTWPLLCKVLGFGCLCCHVMRSCVHGRLSGCAQSAMQFEWLKYAHRTFEAQGLLKSASRRWAPRGYPTTLATLAGINKTAALVRVTRRFEYDTMLSVVRRRPVPYKE